MTIQRVVLGAIASTLLVLTGCAQIQSWRNTAKTTDQDAEHIVSVARLAERRGEIDAARDVYKKLIAEGLATKVAHHRLGVIAAKENDLPRATKQFQASRAAGNESIDLEIDIAYAKFLGGDEDSANALLSGVLMKEPANKRALNNMAILRASQGRFDDSLALTRRVVGPAKAHANIGYLQTQFGDIDAASNSFHAALAKDPELKIAAQALLQLDQPNQVIAPPSMDNMLTARKETEPPSPEQPKMLPMLAKTEPVAAMPSAPASLPAAPASLPAAPASLPAAAASLPAALATLPSTPATVQQTATPSPIQPVVVMAEPISHPTEAAQSPVIRRNVPVRLASSQIQPIAGEQIEEEIPLPAIHFQLPTLVQTGELETSGSDSR